MANDGRRIRRLRSGVYEAPLIKPYELSFATLTSFDVVWVLAEHDDGSIGLGEAVPLPGYNWETADTVRTTVGALCEAADGIAVSAIMQRCRDVRREHPFAASAVMAALDLPFFLDRASSRERFPISAPVAADWPVKKLRHTVDALLSSGYGYIKVKVGRDTDNNARAARCLLTEWSGRQFGVVFDANQAHTVEEALTLSRVLRDCASPRLQWYEQPVDRQDWAGMERLCRAGDAPIVLDECIYDEADVARAAAINAHGVKLKLIKNFGIAETLSLARKARALGLTVVFGNGVATDIGNLGEYLTLATAGGMFAAACECSGFAKLREPLLDPLLSIDQAGQFCLSAAVDTVKNAIAKFSGVQIAFS
jgi:L-alanine-DL-glutamate epimerase-like enolase superfamily enzyme